MKAIYIGVTILLAAACTQQSPLAPDPMDQAISSQWPANEAHLAASSAGGRPLTAVLTGEAEVPGPGDPDGSGTASIRLNQGAGEVCFSIVVSDIAPATAAHIHEGPADQAGPVIVTLSPPPSSGSSSGCVAAPPRVIKAIRKNPSDFYVNVHNEEFPAGALRGQLSK